MKYLSLIAFLASAHSFSNASNIDVMYYTCDVASISEEWCNGDGTFLSSKKVSNLDFPDTLGGCFGSSEYSRLVLAKFKGFIQFPKAGDWELFINSDDGSKLYINDDPDPIVTNLGVHGMIERSAIVTVSSDFDIHTFKVEVFEWEYGCALIMSWSHSDYPKEVIPSTAFVDRPSVRPSEIPSKRPSGIPSKQPSVRPSEIPSKRPSDIPSIQPSVRPSEIPSKRPSDIPSIQLSVRPSEIPSKRPSGKPSGFPSMTPSMKPFQNNIGNDKPAPKPVKPLTPGSKPTEKPIQKVIGNDKPAPKPVKPLTPGSKPTGKPIQKVMIIDAPVLKPMKPVSKDGTHVSKKGRKKKGKKTAKLVKNAGAKDKHKEKKSAGKKHKH